MRFRHGLLRIWLGIYGCNRCIKTQSRVALFEQAGAFKAAIALAELLFPAMFGDDQRAWSKDANCAQQAQRRSIFFRGVIGRIEKDQVEDGEVLQDFG